MTRPVKNTVDYFPHDALASESDTLTILQGRYGNDGYAFWFKLLEKLSTADNHVIDCRNPVKWQLLLAKCNIGEEKGLGIMDLLAELDAIDGELWRTNKIIWCQKLVNRVSGVYQNRKRNLPLRPVVNGITTNNNAITTAVNPQSKVKESKVNIITNTSNNNKSHFGEFSNVLLSEDEHKKLVNKFGETETGELIERLSRGIASKGYRYKSHYATILNWQRTENQRGGNRGDGRGNSKKLPPRDGYTEVPLHPDLTRD